MANKNWRLCSTHGWKICLLQTIKTLPSPRLVKTLYEHYRFVDFLFCIVYCTIINFIHKKLALYPRICDVFAILRFLLFLFVHFIALGTWTKIQIDFQRFIGIKCFNFCTCTKVLHYKIVIVRKNRLKIQNIQL